MREDAEPMIKYADGDAYMWTEQESSIHLKVVTKDFNDPLELTANEARDIAKALLRLAGKLDKIDG